MNPKPDDQQGLKIEHRIKLEKRTEAGELYETVEITSDGHGGVTSAKVTYRKKGLALPEAYAPIKSTE